MDASAWVYPGGICYKNDQSFKKQRREKRITLAPGAQ